MSWELNREDVLEMERQQNSGSSATQDVYAVVGSDNVPRQVRPGERVDYREAVIGLPVATKG